MTHNIGFLKNPLSHARARDPGASTALRCGRLMVPWLTPTDLGGQITETVAVETGEDAGKSMLVPVPKGGKEEALDRAGHVRRLKNERAITIVRTSGSEGVIPPHFYLQAGFQISSGGTLKTRGAVLFANGRQLT